MRGDTSAERRADRRRRFGRSWVRAVPLVALAAVGTGDGPGSGRAWAQARTGPEAERRKLIEKLGLPAKAPPPADAGAAAGKSPPADGPSAPAALGGGAGGATVAVGGAPRLPPPPVFRGRVHRQLIQSCKVCHMVGGPAGATRFVLGGDARPDFASTRPLVDTANARAGLLLTKGAGQAHAGGAPLPEGSPGYRVLFAWVVAGARLDAPAEAVAATAPPAAGAAVAGAGVAATPPPRRSRGGGGRPPRTGGAPVPGAAGTSGDRAVLAPVATAVPPPSVAAPPSTAAAPEAVTTSGSGGDAIGATGAGPAAAPGTQSIAGPTFADAYRVLQSRCQLCHNPQGQASISRLRLEGDGARDHAALLPMVATAAPASSLLLRKGAGELHAGGPTIAAGSAPDEVLRAWIAAGAPGPEAPVVVAAPAAGVPSSPAPGEIAGDGRPPAAEAAAPGAAGPPVPSPASSPHAPGAPLSPGLLAALASGVRINGRFDLNYERRAISGSPFVSGQDAFESYHHFIFVSRDAASDPFGFTAEIIEQRFWELSGRWRAPSGVWGGMVKAGKVVVPFGVEPLFHQSYGGHAGFDQRILPIVWAVEGIVGQVDARWGALTVTDDIFVGRGHRLAGADAVLNLQTNISASDDATVALGNRLGVSFGPANAWYSFYYSPLGFGRRLVMQALDVELWRIEGVPILDRLTVGLGAMRADISGGGPGLDHYHFGDYLLVRVRLLDYLHLQYRQGLRTFNNRRGTYIDSRRLTAEDGSTHNIGLVYRRRGLTFGLFQFWNLEKVDEVRDDLFRAVVAYDF
jgi:hypothetical protein